MLPLSKHDPVPRNPSPPLLPHPTTSRTCQSPIRRLVLDPTLILTGLPALLVTLQSRTTSLTLSLLSSGWASQLYSRSTVPDPSSLYPSRSQWMNGLYLINPLEATCGCHRANVSVQSAPPRNTTPLIWCSHHSPSDLSATLSLSLNSQTLSLTGNL